MIFQRCAYPSTARALVVGFLLLTPVIAQAAPKGPVVYVDCDRGNDANSGLTPEAPKRTVWAGLHSTSDGSARSLIVSGSCGRSDLTPSTAIIRGHKCQTDPRRGVATFKLRFAQIPDFFTLDELGVPATSFQYFADAGGRPSGVADFYAAAAGEGDASGKTLLRGEEIHVDGDLRVRSIVPLWDEPGSGGWGPIVGEVDYSLVDATLSFEVPLSVLKDTGDGVVWYLLEGYSHGFWDGVTLAGLCRAPAQRPSRPTR
jgi:hypothetical protein